MDTNTTSTTNNNNVQESLHRILVQGNAVTRLESIKYFREFSRVKL